MKHKALWITLAVVAILGISLFSWVKGTYNTMVAQDENVKTAWSQVENQYQRRVVRQVRELITDQRCLAGLTGTGNGYDREIAVRLFYYGG